MKRFLHKQRIKSIFCATSSHCRGLSANMFICVFMVLVMARAAAFWIVLFYLINYSVGHFQKVSPSVKPPLCFLPTCSLILDLYPSCTAQRGKRGPSYPYTQWTWLSAHWDLSYIKLKQSFPFPVHKCTVPMAKNVCVFVMCVRRVDKAWIVCVLYISTWCVSPAVSVFTRM